MASGLPFGAMFANIGDAWKTVGCTDMIARAYTKAVSGAPFRGRLVLVALMINGTSMEKNRRGAMLRTEASVASTSARACASRLGLFCFAALSVLL